MARCPQCGKKYSRNARFCPHCSSSLPPAADRPVGLLALPNLVYAVLLLAAVLCTTLSVVIFHSLSVHPPVSSPAFISVTEDTAQSGAAQTDAFRRVVADNNDVRITVTGLVYTPPTARQDAFMKLLFTAENLTDADLAMMVKRFELGGFPLEMNTFRQLPAQSSTDCEVVFSVSPLKYLPASQALDTLGISFDITTLDYKSAVITPLTRVDIPDFRSQLEVKTPDRRTVLNHDLCRVSVVGVSPYTLDTYCTFEVENLSLYPLSFNSDFQSPAFLNGNEVSCLSTLSVDSGQTALISVDFSYGDSHQGQTIGSLLQDRNELIIPLRLCPNDYYNSVLKAGANTVTVIFDRDGKLIDTAAELQIDSAMLAKAFDYQQY